MRIYIHLTSNTKIVPYNYQRSLVGALHRWLGPNELHDDVSLYSLSWLSKGVSRRGGLDFPEGSTFFLSSPKDEILTDLIKGMTKGHQVAWGMEIDKITIQRTPTFSTRHRFEVQSPVLIKRSLESKDNQKYYFFDDDESGDLLTQTIQTKMQCIGWNENIQIQFDKNYTKPKRKLVKYNGIKILGSICPIIAEGSPEAIQFLWEVGAGNSTGIGFGALI